MRLILATTNQGKVRELRRIFRVLNIELVGLTEGSSTEEIEVGSSFEENALLKAEYYSRTTGQPTIADDSGLEVDVLGGAPGIHSAHYGGPGLDDGERVVRLLSQMEAVKDGSRGARFVCAAAYVSPELRRVFVQTVRGEILRSPRGTGGFGYDPVFFYPPLGMTFGELDPASKLAVSHRGLAFSDLRDWLISSGLA
jgi:XTP/dITP diphosphohydrolase